MGTFQPNKRRTQTSLPQSTSRPTRTTTENHPQLPSTSRPTNVLQLPTSHSIPRSTPRPSEGKLQPSPFPPITRLHHRTEAIFEFDKLINFLLQHRPQVAERFVIECWELYKVKYKNKNRKAPNSALTSPKPSVPISQPVQQPPILTASDTATAPTPDIRQQPSIPNTTHPNGSNDAPSPPSPPPAQLSPPSPKPALDFNIPLLVRQAEFEKLVYQRWRCLVSAQHTSTEHLSHEDQQYVIWKASASCKSPIILDGKSCCMALLDASSKLSDVHLKALRFLWYNLIEDTCTGAIFNHGIGYPRTHIIYLFAQLVINSPDRAKTRILIICPRSSHSQWEMSSEAFENMIDIHHLSKSHWQENINQWRARGGVLLATHETYYNILVQSHSPEKRAALAALCSPGPDICILDEASRINNRTELPLLQRILNRTRTKSRLALTSLPLAGFITRAWAIADWACPSLFGTSIEYQWKYVDPIARGHKRDASIDDAKLGFSKACLLYNKMGMVTFSVDSGTRKEALLSKGLSLHESVVWINLSREEYAIYREVEVFLNGSVTNEQLSPYIASDLLICAASSVHALRSTLKTWAEADSAYLESIGHRRTFERYQDSLLRLFRIVNSRLEPGLTCTKLQLALYVGRECLLKKERLVIFASSQELFEDTYRFLRSQLEEAEVHGYDAASSFEVRIASIDRFNTAEDGAILVAPYGPNYHCMEEAGWGFVNATRVLFIDSSWHSGACVQAVNRVHSFAQMNSKAHIHHFLARDTVEFALSSVLDWTYKHMSSCDSSTLPSALTNELDERSFLLAPEVSSFWIRANPPQEVSRSQAPSIKRSELGEHVDLSDSNEHDNLILPLQKTENTSNRDKCVHEIVLNCNRYRTLSENLDMWMRSEWSQRQRYLREPDDDMDRKESVKVHRDSLHMLGDMLHKASSGDSGGWLARAHCFMEYDSDVCHLLNSWEPYRRLYERSVEISDLPTENGSKGEKRPRPDSEERDSPPKTRRVGDA